MRSPDGFTVDQIKMLIVVERAMENGEQPYVVVDGQKWAFPGEILAALGLASGETVSREVCYQMQLLNLAHLKELIAEQTMEKLIAEEGDSPVGT